MGCRRYGYFILGHFVVRHITWSTGKMSADKTLWDKMPAKFARWDKMLSILWDREMPMPVLSKHFIYDTDGQVN